MISWMNLLACELLIAQNLFLEISFSESIKKILFEEIYLKKIYSTAPMKSMTKSRDRGEVIPCAIKIQDSFCQNPSSYSILLGRNTSVEFSPKKRRAEQ